MASDLSRVSVLVKTFLRDAMLFETVSAITTMLPEVQMIVVDDGENTAIKEKLYETMRAAGHDVVQLPFDSGFGKKSNVGSEICKREYLLIASDDFDFRPKSVREGIEKLVKVLDATLDHVAIASGRVNGLKYEGWLTEEDLGRRIRERYISYENPGLANGVEYHICNLTVNYSLIRTIIFRGSDRIKWDDEAKIGQGEHGMFFLDVMRAGYNVAYVPGVEIKEQAIRYADPRYYAFRGRASQPGRSCFKKRGVEEYVLFDGSIERA